MIWPSYVPMLGHAIYQRKSAIPSNQDQSCIECYPSSLSIKLSSITRQKMSTNICCFCVMFFASYSCEELGLKLATSLRRLMVAKRIWCKFSDYGFLWWSFTGAPAREVLKDACQDLMMMCQHVRSTFDKAISDYKMRNPEDMDTNGTGSV